MPRTNVRVKIPSDPSAIIELLGKVQTKHLALGAASPLGGLKWDKITPALADAGAHDAEVNRLKPLLESEYGQRDVPMPLVTQGLRDARDVLLGLNSSNPKALGDFGFEVDDSPRAAKPPAAGTKPAG